MTVCKKKPHLSIIVVIATYAFVNDIFLKFVPIVNNLIRKSTCIPDLDFQIQHIH